MRVRIRIILIHKIIRTLDADNNGFLDFTEFLLSMDLVAARSVFSTSSFSKITNKQKLCRTIEEKLLWCFKLYDADNSGVIDRNEMGNIMEVQKNSVTDVTNVKS